jgi:hypothetical protein
MASKQFERQYSLCLKHGTTYLNNSMDLKSIRYILADIVDMRRKEQGRQSPRPLRRSDRSMCIHRIFQSSKYCICIMR